jgi:hypothetical protein
MKTLLDRLIGQLDTLMPFLSLSREDVFQILNEHRIAWFPENREALPAAYATYRRQINHSAVLLGYSYFESFLVDLLVEILRNRPAMLLKSKKLDYSEILDSPDKRALVDKLIQREIHELFYKSMEEIVEELRKRYNFTITDDEARGLTEASLIRNCIIHNSSRADSRLSSLGKYQKDKEFEVSAGEVHSYGIMLRNLVRRLYQEACENHGVGVEHDAPRGSLSLPRLKKHLFRETRHG